MNKDEVYQILTRIPNKEKDSCEMSFDMLLSLSRELFRKLPKQPLVSKPKANSSLARAAACIQLVMQGSGGYQIESKVLAKAAYMSSKDIDLVATAIQQRNINDSCEFKTNVSSHASVASQSSNKKRRNLASVTKNLLSMNELAVKCYSSSDFNGDINDLSSAATSLLEFCKEKTKEYHKSKHAAAIAEIDRNMNAYMAACFITVCHTSDQRRIDRSRHTVEVLNIARVSKKDYIRVEKIVQDIYFKWCSQKERKRSTASDLNSNDLGLSQNISSKRAKVIGRASKDMYYDETFIENVSSVVADNAQNFKPSTANSTTISGNEFLDSLTKRLKSLPDTEEWKESVLSKAREKYGSLDAAVDYIDKRYH